MLLNQTAFSKKINDTRKRILLKPFCVLLSACECKVPEDPQSASTQSQYNNLWRSHSRFAVLRRSLSLQKLILGFQIKQIRNRQTRKEGGWDGVGRESHLFLKFLAMYVYFPVPSFKQKKEMVFLPINRPNTGVFDIFSCCALENAVQMVTLVLGFQCKKYLVVLCAKAY